MTYTKTAVSMATILLALAGGCNRTPAEEQQRAEEAQKKANQEVRQADRERAREEEANREPVRGTEAQTDESQRHEARKDEGRSVDEAQREATEKENEARSEANKETREANHAIAEDRLDLREWSQKKLVGLDKSIGELSIKAQEAESSVHARVEPSLKQLRADRDVLVKDIAAIDTKAAAQLDSYKKQLEDSFDKLEKRVDQLHDEM